jgi:hypothetical protein
MAQGSSASLTPDWSRVRSLEGDPLELRLNGRSAVTHAVFRLLRGFDGSRGENGRILQRTAMEQFKEHNFRMSTSLMFASLQRKGFLRNGQWIARTWSRNGEVVGSISGRMF